MKFPGFIGPSYTLQSVNLDAQRTVNLIPQVNETGRGKEAEVVSFINSPGLTLKVTAGTGPIRGMHYATNGTLYVVSGDTVYNISSSYVATSVGTIGTSSGQVSMADNGTSMFIVDGDSGYIVTLSNDAFVETTDPDFTAADVVVYQDGFFIFNDSNSEEIFISDADGTGIQSVSNQADSFPDNIISMISNHRDLWIFGTDSIEVFFNSGNATFPFERIEGAFIEYGCAAAFSVAKMNNDVYWLGKDATGDGIIYRGRGYEPERISTHAVEFAIRSYSTISDAVAYTYQEDGHYYYVLNFTDANTTWVYDSSTGMWHERTYTNDGQFERHRANCHAFAYNTHVVGDYSNGKVYEMSSSVYSDDSAEIRRLRSAPHISSELDHVFYHSFQLDMEVGVGLDGSATTQGNNPQAMLQWSNDGGHTWSNEIWTSFGKIGNRLKRAVWRKLGYGRDRIFRVVISDPVKVIVVGAQLRISKGGH